MEKKKLYVRTFLRGWVVIVRPLDVRVLMGVAHLQHGHILSVSLLHIHVVSFALEGQDHITVCKDDTDTMEKCC